MRISLAVFRIKFRDVFRNDDGHTKVDLNTSLEDVGYTEKQVHETSLYYISHSLLSISAPPTSWQMTCDLIKLRRGRFDLCAMEWNQTSCHNVRAIWRCDLINVAVIIYASEFALWTERGIVILKAEEFLQNHFLLTLRT